MDRSTTTALPSPVPPLVQYALPFEATIPPSPLLPSGLTSNNIPSRSSTAGLHFSSSALGSIGTRGGCYSLSGGSSCSSISSSLISLNQAASPNNNGSAVMYPCKLGLSSQSSASTAVTIPRTSRWLKLRVCPSWSSHPPTPSVSQSSGDPAAVKLEDTDTQETGQSNGSTADVVQPATAAVDTASCPFSPDICPYAHPTENVRVDGGHVTVCYDFIKVSSMWVICFQVDLVRYCPN